MRNKNLLWVVDCQHDFMDRNGALYVDNAESIKQNLRSINQFARDNGISIINTSDWHNSNSTEFSDEPDFINTFPPHCVANTYGADIIPEVKPDKYDLVVEWNYTLGRRFISADVVNLPHPFNILIKKDKFDVFSGNPYVPQVVEILKSRFDKVYVTGVSGNVCVNQAVLGLVERGFDVKVVTDCVSNLTSIPSCEPQWLERGVELVTLSQI